MIVDPRGAPTATSDMSSSRRLAPRMFFLKMNEELKPAGKVVWLAKFSSFVVTELFDIEMRHPSPSWNLPPRRAVDPTV